KDAVNQQIGGEEQHQDGQRQPGQGKGKEAEDHRRDAAQRQRPPIADENVVHGSLLILFTDYTPIWARSMGAEASRQGAKTCQTPANSARWVYQSGAFAYGV